MWLNRMKVVENRWKQVETAEGGSEWLDMGEDSSWKQVNTVGNE